ncbi:MAG: riboflavin synthase [Candidatus Hatepunaea meridiana]|nr:riboflavin synthase [Candidatus Hatepunaea meridiana]
MFTGLIEEVGTIAAKQIRSGNTQLTIKAEKVIENLNLGDSVAINGVCLTVNTLERNRFGVEASAHTVSNSTVGNWQVSRQINLERALLIGDRLGGHIVQGHVDGIGKVTNVRYGEGSTDIFIEAPESIMKLMAPRGSVAVDGVSLTLADKTARSFKLMVIPYTLQHTCLGNLKPGDTVNIESDLIIRWLADRFKDSEVTDESKFFMPGGESIHLED